MNTEDFFKKLSIIFYSMLFSQIIILFIAIYLLSNNFIKTNSEISFILMVVFMIIIFPLIVVGAKVYRKIISNNSVKNLLIEDKLILYRKGIILKLAFVEVPFIYSVTSFLITGNYVFIIFSIFFITLFYLHKPSEIKFSQDFNLNNFNKN
jgi:RsiW-degrading membrane proteinase PrsW (M82 family)